MIAVTKALLRKTPGKPYTEEDLLGLKNEDFLLPESYFEMIFSPTGKIVVDKLYGANGL